MKRFIFLLLPLFFGQVVVPLHAQTIKTDSIYYLPSQVDRVPQFPGGESLYLRFFATKMRFPAEGKEKGVQGQVLASFVIDTTGKITEAKIVKGVCTAYNEEVLRIINLLPLWQPAVKNGKKVSYRFYQPVSFIIKNGWKRPFRKFSEAKRILAGTQADILPDVVMTAVKVN